MDLAERFAQGGERELEEVIAVYGEKLLRYAVTILASFHDAEDIVQDVFIAAYKSRAGFNPALGAGQACDNLSAWLYRITYNRCVNHAKRRRFVLFAQTPEQADIAGGEPPPCGDEFSENTLHALSRLKPPDRALIHAKIIDERSYEDMAQEFNASPAALRKRYERAKKKLSGHLRKGEDL